MYEREAGVEGPRNQVWPRTGVDMGRSQNVSKLWAFVAFLAPAGLNFGIPHIKFIILGVASCIRCRRSLSSSGNAGSGYT